MPEQKRKQLKMPEGHVVYLNLKQWEDDRRYWKHSKSELKKKIEKFLQGIPRESINQDYTLEERETVILLKDYDTDDPVFKGKVKMPEHLVDENPGQQLDDDIL
ncbi:MAG: hypothetical protein ABEJ56_05750 [Candidatus Nanohaloarchaea archaeon]